MPADVKAALVHDWLNGMRGGEKVLEGLSELYPNAPIYTLLCEPQKISAQLRAHRIRASFIQKLPGWKKNYRIYLPLMPAAIGRFDFNEFDLILSTSHCVAKSAVKPIGALHICYCHSPMRYVWDLYEHYVGDYAPWHPKRAGLAAMRPWLRRWDRRTAPRVDHFIANSYHIANKIKRFYGRDAAVIYPPVDTESYRLPDKTKEREFYLVASALVPYKKLDQSVRAFARREDTLVIAGSGPEAGRLREMATPNVRFIGWQEPEKLRRLYQHCRALIFPGVEDFGIVPVEAMACGAPVIAYGEGGLTETVLDGETGLLYEEQTVDCLLEALERFERRSFDPTASRRQAERFSRPRFMREIRDFIDEAWAAHTGRSKTKE